MYKGVPVEDKKKSDESEKVDFTKTLFFALGRT
jgi:hypothetical protein